MTDRERLSQLEEVVAEMLGKQDMLAELQHDIRDGQAELRSGIDSILTLLKK